MIRDPDMFDMIVHMDNMYAAAIYDLVHAKETTMARQRALVARYEKQEEERRRRLRESQAETTLEEDLDSLGNALCSKIAAVTPSVVPFA